MSTSPFEPVNSFEADYFDGQSSARHAVRVEVDEHFIRIRGEAVALNVARADVSVSPRLGSTPIRIALPLGGLLVTPDYGRVAALLGVPASKSLAHRLESRPRTVLVSLAGLVAAGWLAQAYGVPWAAREVAQRLPPGVESELSSEGLEGMDKVVFKPSRLTPERQAQLLASFAAISRTAGVPATVQFRDGGWIGANACAIPGSIVIVTDQLVELLDDDEQVMAVLSHELGHVRNHHTTRMILQDSMVALLATMVLGDVSAVASLATTIPTILLHTGYSRDFEREADQFAFALLKQTGRSPRLFAQALTTLQDESKRDHSSNCPVPRDKSADEAKKPDGDVKDKPTANEASNFGYLSSHPGIAERIQAAEDAARQ